MKFIGETVGVTGQKTLMDSCKVDDHLGVRRLLLNGANPTAQDFHGNDAAYYCVLHNSLRSLQALFELAADRLQANMVYGKKKRNLLTICTIYGNDIRILEYLLNNGVMKLNANQTDRFQRNALFYSLFRNRVEEVRQLITVSSLDIPDLRGMYLLDYALQFNYLEILLELVKGGARLGLKQKKGVEIMMHAARIGDGELIKALVAKNVSMCSLGDTGENALMVALQAGKKQLITDLCSYLVAIDPFNQQDRN